MTTGKQLLFGLRLDALTTSAVLDLCDQALASRRRMLIGVVNAAKIVKLRRDELLRTSLLECDILLADGQAVVWASRLLRRPLPQRVAGVDLFESLLQRGDRDRRSVYLLGAKPEVLAALREHVNARFPHLTIAGSHDGYFRNDESADVAAEIAHSGADMLFLGMTTPKKEIFLGTYGDSLGVPVLHGVGGAFDILAGATKRAPQRWQRLGMEWLYRVVQEPRRMWWRYLSTNSAFLWLTAREFVRPTPPYTARRGREVSD